MFNRVVISRRRGRIQRHLLCLLNSHKTEIYFYNDTSLIIVSLSSHWIQPSEPCFYGKPTWRRITCHLHCVFHNLSTFIPDYSSPVIMLTCVKPKLPCSCFKKPRLGKNSPYLRPQPLMLSPDACQWPLRPHQLHKHLWKSAPLCGFVTSSLPPLPSSSLHFYLSMFLACCSASTHNRNLIILGGVQMVGAVRQTKMFHFHSVWLLVQQRGS